MKMMLPDVIGHENQSQHCPDHRCLCLVLSGRIITPDRFSYHTGSQIRGVCSQIRLEVSNLKTEVSNLRSGGIRLNSTTANYRLHVEDLLWIYLTKHFTLRLSLTSSSYSKLPKTSLLLFNRNLQMSRAPSKAKRRAPAFECTLKKVQVECLKFQVFHLK